MHVFYRLKTNVRVQGNPTSRVYDETPAKRMDATKMPDPSMKACLLNESAVTESLSVTALCLVGFLASSPSLSLSRRSSSVSSRVYSDYRVLLPVMLASRNR